MNDIILNIMGAGFTLVLIALILFLFDWKQRKKIEKLLARQEEEKNKK